MLIQTNGIRPVPSASARPVPKAARQPSQQEDVVFIRFGSNAGLGPAVFPEVLPNQLDLSSYTGGQKVLINGKLEDWSGPTDSIASVLMTRNPDGSLNPVNVAELASMSSTEALGALEAAKKAYNKGHGKWPAMPLTKRIAAMRQFVSAMKQQRDITARLIMTEIGKSEKDAYKEFDRTVEYIEKTVEVADKLAAREKTLKKVGSVLVKEALKPRGVTLCLGPSNYPLNETFTNLIPALLMGNPVICKLPKTGALSVTPLYEAFAKSFPPGTINFISGDGPTLITPIMKSGDIDTLAFIGSAAAARRIASNHPDTLLLNLVLGLGAKNAGIILPDATIDQTLLKETVTGALSFNGQRCTALKVLMTPKSRAAEFVTKLSSAVDQLKMGLPNEPGVQITPLPPSSLANYKALLDDALAKGAKVMNKDGGKITGTFFKPAVVYPVTPDMRLYHEEQFGPLVPVVEYNDLKPDGKSRKDLGLKQVINYVTKLSVGQQVSVFGNDPKTLRKVVHGLQNQVCRININSQCQRGPDELPFVGRKESAVGILSIEEALLRFTLPNLLSGNDNPTNQQLLGSLDL